MAASNSPPSILGDWREVARRIDHTLLRPDVTAAQVAQLCAEAAHFLFAAVCVNPTHVALSVAQLRDTPVRVATVIGFPLGATLTTAKRFEAEEAIKLGADELDMVLNVGALKAGERALVEADIRSVAQVAHDAGALLKVILETVLLSDEEKRVACELALSAGADFVKTCTGFGGGGATVADVALMRRAVGSRAGVKASGGIRSAADVAAMVAAGADRIGTSSSVAIMAELRAPAFAAGAAIARPGGY
ncbi:MAG: deoxyribose-phosphate aldolase [Acidobacteria bacterium]|nr:deoxyribose-phosphate aldolase [Acidobacteriota bacterium]